MVFLLNKKEVIKHSAAIQIRNEITLLQRKAWNVLLANAFYDLPSKEIYQINITELCEVLGDVKDTTHLKESLKALVKCGLEWNILNKDGKNKWGVTTLLAHAEIENNICTYSYSPILRERLYNPNMYARISLAIQNKFSSKHALALYELCKDYFDIKRNYGETPWINIPQFRNLMGIKDDEYTDFKKLNKWTITNPSDEINKESDIHITPKFKKENRKVIAVKLCIQRNPNKMNILNLAAAEEPQVKQLPTPNTKPLSLSERLEKLGLTPAQAKSYFNDYDNDNINKILDTVEDKFNKGTIKNITAYTITSLKNSANQSKAPIEIDKENQAAINIEKKKELAEQQRIIDQLQQRFHDHKTAKINEIISNEVDKEKLFQEFEVQLKKDASYEIIKAVNSPDDIIHILFQDYIANHYLETEDRSFMQWTRKKGYKLQQEPSGEYIFAK
jgi:hypothetical protein